MKFLEVVYLTASIILLAFLLLQFGEMESSHRLMLGAGAVLFGLGFFFRRTNRLKMERIFREHADTNPEQEQ